MKSWKAGFPSLASDAETIDALEKAFDYRGDVTISSQEWLDRRGIYLRSPHRRLVDGILCPAFPKDSDEKMVILYSDIAGLAFSGKDRAAGASWEAWVKKWKEKKASRRKGIRAAPGEA